MKIQWEEDDSIEKIAVNNHLNVQYVVDLFKANDYNKGKTIAIIEQELEEAHKKYQEHLNSPEHKKTMESITTLLGMAGVVGAMSPYFYDTFEALNKYNDFLNKPSKNSKRIWSSYKQKEKKISLTFFI